MPLIAARQLWGPRMVLAHRDPDFRALAFRTFRRLGWEIQLAGTGEEARLLTREFAPALVVLGDDLPDESGWLSCKKLVCSHPGVKVALVAGRINSISHDYAAFVGATVLIDEASGIDALVDGVGDAVLAGAGC